jgi:hypothetical protein
VHRFVAFLLAQALIVSASVASSLHVRQLIGTIAITQTSDQTIWLALALETLFWVSGTIVGTAPILRAVQL